MIRLIMENNNLINKYTNKHRTFKYSPDNKFITVYVDGRRSGFIFNNDRIITIDGDKVRSSDFFDDSIEESKEPTKESVDNIEPEYGVLFTSDSSPTKAFIANFYDDEDEAFSFLNDAEVIGKDVFSVYDPDILEKNSGYKPDSRGRCYYHAYTPDGDEYLQEVRVVNMEPIYIA